MIITLLMSLFLQADSADLVVFCGPGPGSTQEAYAGLAARVVEAKQEGAIVVCLESAQRPEEDAFWSAFNEWVPVDVALPSTTQKVQHILTFYGADAEIPDDPQDTSGGVLLFSGSEDQACAWAETVGAKLVLLASPFVHEKPVRIGAVTLVHVPFGGRFAIRLRIDAQADLAIRELQLLGPAGMPPALAEHLPEREPFSPRPAADSSPKELVPGVAFPLRVKQELNGIGLRGQALKLSSSFGSHSSSTGVYATVHLSLENRIPFQMVRESPQPVAYQVNNIFDHVFLYVDGRHVVPLGLAENTGFDREPHLLLPAKGEKKQLRLTFSLADLPRRSLELIFLDERRGRFALLLWGEKQTAPEFAVGPQANDLLSFGVAAFEEPGNHYLKVDLAGKSELRGLLGDTECGFVTHFSPRRYLQLVEDDLFTYDCLEGEEAFAFHGLQKFLPHRYHHGILSFSVPEEHGELKLWVFIPPNRSVKDGNISVAHLEPIVLPLGGSALDRHDPGEPLRTITDGDLIRLDIFAPEETAENTTLTLEVTNLAKQEEIFRPYEQVLLLTREEQRPADEAALLHPTPERLRLPPGATRRFLLGFKTKGYGVVYRGFERADITPFPGRTVPPDTARSAPGRTHQATESGSLPVERKALPAPKQVTLSSAAPQGLKGVNLTPEEVNRAIDKGAAFLAEILLSGGTGLAGYDYLLGYAVLHSGHFRGNPELASYVLDFFRNQPAEDTYSVGLRLMGLRELDPASNRKLISQCASYLIGYQSASGLWDYGPNQVQEKVAKDGELIVIGGQPIKGSGAEVSLFTEKLPVVRDEESWRIAGGDYSCSQYAVLGLKAAEESGLLVPREVWQLTAKAVAEGQAEDGGWSYGPGGSTGYGSMTTAGFAAYLIACHYGRIEPDEQVVQRGYEWLSRYFTVEENPGAGAWLYYYLYGLERAGVIGGVEFFGENEWYPLLARKLVDEQQEDGSWLAPDQADPETDTAFALLCLSRATVPLGSAPSQAGHGDGNLVTGWKGPAHVTYVILDASRSMRAEFSGKTRMHWAKQAIRDLVSNLPRGSAIALRVYGARTRPNDPLADEDSVLLVPGIPGTGEVVMEILDRIQANGRTPLCLSLQQTKDDLKKLAESVPVTVVLLCDGEESSPGQDPFKAANQLMKRPEADFQVIALATEAKATTFLERLAAAGNGDFQFAGDRDQLSRAIVESIRRRLPFRVLDRFGKETLNGNIGESLALPEGRYEMEVRAQGNTYVRPFWINTDKKTLILFSPPQRR